MSHTAAQKLKTIQYAEEHGNRPFARHFGVSESCVRLWRKTNISLCLKVKKQTGVQIHLFLAWKKNSLTLWVIDVPLEWALLHQKLGYLPCLSWTRVGSNIQTFLILRHLLVGATDSWPDIIYQSAVGQQLPIGCQGIMRINCWIINALLLTSVKFTITIFLALAMWTKHQ